MGKYGLIIRNRNEKYSKEVKEQAVLDYLNEKGSLHEICKKYQINSNKQLRNWIKVYNGHKEFRNTREIGEIYMTKGRKTTIEERVEIVAYCIEHNKNYAEAIEKYSVSYQQIYLWMRKYEAKGIDGLQDRRGKSKPDEMTAVDRLRAENKMLTAKNLDLEMENTLLKKLKELERRGH